MGYTRRVLEHLSKARVQSSHATYESRWKVFERFCFKLGVDPFEARGPLVADFLVFIAQSRSASVATIAGFRSAIGAVLRLSTGFNPGECPIIAQIMRSFKRTQPLPAKRIPQWDVAVVLDAFCEEQVEDESLPLQIHTAKAVFLVSLASGDRCHALAALAWPPSFDDNRVRLSFLEDFVPKSFYVKTNQSRIQPLLIEGVLTNELKKVCTVNVLRSYAERTSVLRSPCQSSLFIPHNLSKCKNLSAQAVARYLVKIVHWAYEKQQQKTPVCRAHDVRKIATTLRELSSTSLSEFLGAGFWTTPNPFLKHYKIANTERLHGSMKKYTGIAVAKKSLSFQEKPASG